MSIDTAKAYRAAGAEFEATVIAEREVLTTEIKSLRLEIAMLKEMVADRDGPPSQPKLTAASPPATHSRRHRVKPSRSRIGKGAKAPSPQPRRQQQLSTQQERPNRERRIAQSSARTQLKLAGLAQDIM